MIEFADDKYGKFYRSFIPDKCPRCGSTDLDLQYRGIWSDGSSSAQIWCNGHNMFFHVFSNFNEWQEGSK